MIRTIVCLLSVSALALGQSCSGNKYYKMNGMCPVGMRSFGQHCCPEDCYSAERCVDLSKDNKSDCPQRTAYCNNSLYRKFMQQQCPETCGFCLCEDKVDTRTGKSECSSKLALCRNSAYYNLMKTECPATCGFC